jgi:hypothetical protein
VSAFFSHRSLSFCNLDFVSGAGDRNTGHQRVHSKILSLPDDLDLFAPSGGDGPSLSDENDEELFSMFLDVDKLNSSSRTLSQAEAESSSTAASAAALPSFTGTWWSRSATNLMCAAVELVVHLHCFVLAMKLFRAKFGIHPPQLNHRY